MARSTRPPSPFTPPPDLIALARKLLEPVRLVTSPVFVGLEKIPSTRPLLFVGNHTLYGALDVPLLFLELYEKKGIFLRGLGDHLHFKIPRWSRFIKRFGAVDGTRENCAALMRGGEAILVFPGGAREVAKRKGEKYKLVWQERLGFARMAIAHGCTIVPFSAVGVEDALDIVYDANDLLKSPVGGLLRQLGVREDVLVPVAKGVGPTPLPRPERLYFAIREPIETASYGGRADDDAACRELRDRVRSSIEDGLVELKALQREDPDRGIWPRLSGAFDTVLARRRARSRREPRR